MTEEQIRQLMRDSPERGNRALFDTYYNYVCAVVFRTVNGTGSREDAEECVIDVFLEVMRRFEEIQPGALKAYIGTVAKNKALNVCRYLSAKSRQTVSIDSEEFSGLASGEEIENSVERSELIAGLGEPDASIIIHKYFLDRNSVEIAGILHMNPVTVRSRTARALKRLKKLLTESGMTL